MEAMKAMKAMKVYIGYQSALEYWRIHRALPEGGVLRRRIVTLPGALPSAGQVRSAGLVLPLHVMLNNPGYRWPSQTIVQHVFSGKTAVGCFVSAGNEFEVSSPEFCFLQMAGQLSLPGLIELGYELCGAYSLPVAGETKVPDPGFYKRRPLTSLKKLSAFVAGMSGFTGHKNAERALRYILEGSASPMETKLAILLTLPYKLGGFGLPKPELNVRIVPSKTAEKAFGKEFYICDLFWPDHNIAVEYDSDQFHTDSKQIANDSTKRNALTMMGVIVLTVTTQQFFRTIEFEKAAGAIAKCLGKRLVYKNPGFIYAYNDLRDHLLPHNEQQGKNLQR